MSRSFDSITHDEDHHHAPTPSQQQQQVSKNGKPSLPSQNTTKNENNQHSTSSSSFVHCHNFLDKIFTNCSNDPVGNVHRTWSITLLMMAIYLIITIFQSKCVCVCGHWFFGVCQSTTYIPSLEHVVSQNVHSLHVALLLLRCSFFLLIRVYWYLLDSHTFTHFES